MVFASENSFIYTKNFCHSLINYQGPIFGHPVLLACPPLGLPLHIGGRCPLGIPVPIGGRRPLGTPVPEGGKCPLGAPEPLGNGFSGLDPLGIGKGAEPDCVVKGPFGGSGADDGGGEGGATDSEPPVGWVPEPPAPAVVVVVEVTVTVTWTVETTV